MRAQRPNLDLLSRALRDQRGNAIIEFALIGPAMLLLLLAVFQIGLQVQNYNAVRNLTSDGSRYAVISYQQGTRSTPSAIATWIRSKGVGSTYNLDTNRLNVTVTTAATSRLAGMTEMTIAVDYNAPQILWTVAGSTLNINYSRPVFLPV